ncbi:MAG: YeaC family protein [Natronospirillum sp.]|uniref:DUF1315 family protein n=1 Tax=Natronospirillum sp. TaxID=2812955 RepID=UPI0025E6C026|nr:DUF1315 family protein [Natronospirillum sp.]MCH8550651.1 YeaC family protein [Natronospirillum sp.]
MASFDETAAQLPRDVIDRMREALALGRWPDGRELTADQKKTTMEAVLTWEAVHLPPEQRTGHIDRSGCGSSESDSASRIPAVTRHDH